MDSHVLGGTALGELFEEALSGLELDVTELAHELLFDLAETAIFVRAVPSELPGQDAGVFKLDEVLVDVEELGVDAGELGLQLFLAEAEQLLVSQEPFPLWVVSRPSYLSIVPLEAALNGEVLGVEGVALVEEV